jgi:xanthine/CO dehydrogenase XdhC/CoxF family maturation factor
MKEHRQIIENWRQGSATILVTLVRVQGSSYRQLGARLMISGSGTYVGGVSAGCLEADLLRKAAWLIRDGSAVERYSTLFEETADIPFGLGCGGVLDVLLEPVGTPECQALLEAIESTLAGAEHLTATWLPADQRRLMRAIFRANGQLLFASEGLSDESLSEARMELFRSVDTELHGMFVERLLPPQRLYVFGAGDDAKPLVTVACLLGWSVAVVDGRGHLAHRTRFPESNAQVIANPDTAIGQIHAQDAAVIMTHSYEQDREYLTALLPLRLRYLGLLGARQRSALLIAEAAAKLDYSVSECCDNICAPVGLDIGGEGPEAIALAIIAEAQACCMGKRDQTRKLSVEHVQRYLANGDAQKFQQAQCGIGAA